MAIVFGALWTGFGAAAWWLLRPPLSPGRALAALGVLPSYWLFTEWARSWQGFGGPWAVLGTSQWQHPAVLALASVGGVWLISFALVAVNTGIVILLLARRNLVRLAGAAGVAVALAAGPVVFALTPSTPAVRHITVALVQQGVQPSRASRVNASLRLSDGLGAARPDLIVWGESSVGYDIERADTGLLGRIRAVAARTGAEILVNQDSTLPGGGKSKVALLISPRGRGRRVRQDAAGPVRRVHPVPRRARLAHQHQQGRAEQHGPRRRRPPDPRGGPGRPAAPARRADLLRVRVPRHVPGGRRPGRAADHLPDLGHDVPVRPGRQPSTPR